jgi:membrane protein YqaA with SNARE-associated domain
MDDTDVPPLGSLLWQVVVGLVVLTVVAGLVALVLAEPIERFGEWFVGQFGLWGVFIGVLVLDALPGTVHEPLLLVANQGGLSYGSIVLVGGAASWLSGALGYGIGAFLGRWPRLHALLDYYRIAPFMRKYGGWAVAVAAITPVPYSITTWGAGATGVRLSVVLAGALLRFPKVALYLALALLGWNAVG